MQRANDKRRRAPWLLAAAGIVTVALLAGRANAAADANANAVSISPTIQTLTFQQGQDSAAYTSSITNNGAASVQVRVTARDFTSFNQTGSLAFLDDTTTTSHGLAAAISFSASTFTLAPGQSQQITVTIHGATKLANGGHYGAVVYQINQSGATSQHGNTVTFNQTIASLVFMSTQGSGTYGMRLLRPQQALAWFHLPSVYNVVVQNTGNVQLTPRGYVSVGNPFGKQVQKGVLNADSGLVLPGTSRLLGTPVAQTSKPFWPGVYHLRVYYRYDGRARFGVSTISFFFVNLWLLAALGAAAALVMCTSLRFGRRRHTAKPRRRLRM